MEDTIEYVGRGEERRQTFRPGDPGRRLLDRIRQLDPTILECGPQCQHFNRHDAADHVAGVAALVGMMAGKAGS